MNFNLFRTIKIYKFLELNDVLYVHSLFVNLIFISRLTKIMGCITFFYSSNYLTFFFRKMCGNNQRLLVFLVLLHQSCTKRSINTNCKMDISFHCYRNEVIKDHILTQKNNLKLILYLYYGNVLCKFVSSFYSSYSTKKKKYILVHNNILDNVVLQIHPFTLFILPKNILFSIFRSNFIFFSWKSYI